MLQDMGKFARFCWVPSHCSVEGNEIADTAATPSAYIPPITLQYRDYYPIFHQVLKETEKIPSWPTTNWVHLKTSLTHGSLQAG